MSMFGSVTPALTLAIAGSFHLVILPMNMSAMRGPVNFRSPVTPGSS
jgi:hypothetical protein